MISETLHLNHTPSPNFLSPHDTQSPLKSGTLKTILKYALAKPPSFLPHSMPLERPMSPMALLKLDLSGTMPL